MRLKKNQNTKTQNTEKQKFKRIKITNFHFELTLTGSL